MWLLYSRIKSACAHLKVYRPVRGVIIPDLLKDNLAKLLRMLWVIIFNTLFPDSCNSAFGADFVCHQLFLIIWTRDRNLMITARLMPDIHNHGIGTSAREMVLLNDRSPARVVPSQHMRHQIMSSRLAIFLEYNYLLYSVTNYHDVRHVLYWSAPQRAGRRGFMEQTVWETLVTI